MCFVVECNNEHSSRYLLLTSEPLKTQRINITLVFERNAMIPNLPKCVYVRTNHSGYSFICRRGGYRAVASGVKGGDDYRGPRLRGAPPVISTDWLRRTWKNAQHIWQAIAARRHVAFARVFRPWQIKNAKEFKAFKHKEKLNWVLGCAVFGAHAESRVSRTARPNRALLRHLLHLNEQIQITV